MRGGFQHTVRFLMGMVLWTVLTWAVPRQVHGQEVAGQVAFPAHPKQNQWHFNPVAHQAFVYQGTEWKQLPVKNCRSVEHCNNLVIIKDGLSYSLADASGNILVTHSPMIYCLYTFVVVGSRNRLDYLLDSEGDTLSAVVDNCKIFMDTLKGDRVYCFPAYSPGLERYSCAQLRNWGMMDTKGNWRIEPMFDKPFQFTRGIAEVWYMGVPRRIDEDGEFVNEE